MTDVQPITPADLPVAARTLARAFATDPVMSWLTGNRPARFARVAQGFFAEEARRMGALGGGWITADGNGAALWAPPNCWKMSLLNTARLAPSSARLYGLRLLRASRALAAMQDEHPREPHWYLSILGTDPGAQRKGLGSALLEPVLARCDRDGLPAYLESSNEANIPFYERHGFKVTGTHHFPGGPRLFPMWRESR
jgi:ribosomal protein S18 acetylase RimI-like enzyme